MVEKINNYIKKIKIENFQSHDNTLIEFDNGLNVITGPSDHGKSAIIRAIRWVLYNQPRGLEFIRHGTKKVKVTLELANGYTVIREKSKSVNRYELLDMDGNSMVLEGFGNEIPSEIVNVFEMPNVVLDESINSYLNIGNQLEGPFLLSESGAVRSKAIGRLTGLHIIDKALKGSIIDLRRENQSRDRIETEKIDIENELSKYKDLDKLKENLDNCELLIHKLVELSKLNGTLELKKQQLKLLQKSLRENNAILEKLQFLNKCEVCLKDSDIILWKLKRFFGIKDKLRVNDVLFLELSDTIDKTKDLDKLDRLIKTISIKRDTQKALVFLLNKRIAFNKELEEIEKTIEKTRLINEANDNVDIIYEKNNRLKQYKEIKKKQDDFNKHSSEGQKFLAKLQNVDLIEEKIKDIQIMISKLERVEKTSKVYKENEEGIKEGEKFLMENHSKVNKFVNEYKDLLKKAGKCPLCESELNELKINDILKHYKEVH